MINNNSMYPARIFTVPGLYGSGPRHWQTLWEQKYGFIRIEQENWDEPSLSKWEDRLCHQVADRGFDDDTFLVAHSLGCHVVVKNLLRLRHKIRGIFFVAPPDLSSAALPMDLSDFDSLASFNSGVPGVLIYSENDPYASVEYSQAFAKRNSLQRFCLGRLGHINSDSNLGYWDEGYCLLRNLLRSTSIGDAGSNGVAA